MKSLSKVFKSADVVIGRPVDIEAAHKEEPKEEPQQPDIDVDPAVVIGRLRFIEKCQQDAAARCYEQAKKAGFAQGKEKALRGLKKLEKAEAQKSEAAFQKNFQKMEEDFKVRYEKAKDDAVREALDFAFGMAEKIFGCSIDRNDPVFRNLLSDDWQVLPKVISEPAAPVREEYKAVPAGTPLSESHPVPAEVKEDLSEAVAAAPVFEGRSADDSESYEFEDLDRLNPRDMQRLIKNIDIKDVAAALKGAQGEVCGAVIGCLPKRSQATIREELDFLGPLPVSEVENAQHRILKTLRRLQKAGEITLMEKVGKQVG